MQNSNVELKEKVVHFDVTPTDGIQILREKANGIQNNCIDYTVKDVDITTLALYCTDKVLAKFTDGHEVAQRFMTNYSLGQLCTKLGVPARYIEKCIREGHSDLAQKNLNTWVEDYGKDLFIRTYKDRVRGVLSSRYSVLDTPDIIDVVDSSTRGLGLKVKEYYMSEERFNCRLIQQELMKINGEDLFAGIQIDSSDVGRSTLTVNFFIYKQVCTNGLCVTKGAGNLFTQKHISICSDDFKEQLSQSLKSLPMLIEEYEHIIQRCALQYNLFGSKYTSGSNETNRLIEDFIQKIKYKTKLSDEGANKVFDLARDRYGLSDWGVVNAITEVAQDYTLERRVELEKIAGGLLKVS